MPRALRGASVTVGRMPRWTVLTAPSPDSLESSDAWALHGAARVSHELENRLWGYPDLMYPAHYLAAHLREHPYSIRRMLVAIPEGATIPTADDVAGFARLSLPIKDNTHLVNLEIYVDPDRARQGVGRALLEAAEALGAEHDRTTVIAWSEQAGEPSPDTPGVLEPPTGSGRIHPDDAGANFALRHGYTFEQAERYSVLRLPVDAALLDQLQADAAERAGAEYRLVSWTDRCPGEWVHQVAVLETRMSTDAPMAELDMKEATWDAERVRTWEREVAESSHGYALAAAEHIPTHTLAAFTVLRYPLDHPEVVFQEDTLVLREHRGRRLGMLVKTENLRRLRELRPDAKRVHTWNAEENAYMLSINVALGFRPTGVIGTWQKKAGTPLGVSVSPSGTAEA